MLWWAWIAVGAILLGSELMFVDAQFYLVFVGAAALAVGFIDAAAGPLSGWLQWLMFAALALGSMIGFRRQIYERLRSRLPIMRSGPAGEMVTLSETLPPGASCRVEHRGSSWEALNGGSAVIAAGDRARIERVDGITLVVHADSNR